MFNLRKKIKSKLTLLNKKDRSKLASFEKSKHLKAFEKDLERAKVF